MKNEKITYTYEDFARDAISIAEGNDEHVDYDLFGDKAQAMLNREVKSRESKANAPKKATEMNEEAKAEQAVILKKLTKDFQTATELDPATTGLRISYLLKNVPNVEKTKVDRDVEEFTSKGEKVWKTKQYTAYRLAA